mgnify:CR=1 FL=1
MVVGRSTKGTVVGMSPPPVFLASSISRSSLALFGSFSCCCGDQIRLGVSGYQSGGCAGVPIALGVRTSVEGTAIGLSGVALIENNPSAVGTGIPPGLTFTTPAGCSGGLTAIA